MSDLGLQLEADTLTFLRTIGIFIVLSIALISFTQNGQIFSIISLCIALVLLTSLIINYFLERSRIATLGFFPRPLIDILMFVMIFVVVFILWMIWSVIESEPVSLGSIAKDIEEKMAETNTLYLQNLQALERQIQDIESGNIPRGTSRLSVGNKLPIGNLPTGKGLLADLQKFGTDRSRANIAALAMTA